MTTQGNTMCATAGSKNHHKAKQRWAWQGTIIVKVISHVHSGMETVCSSGLMAVFTPPR